MDKKTVILGAGFGGIRAAVVLGKKIKRGKLKNHEVILIDKHDYHTFTPTLYEISTTSKETANYLDLKSVNTFPIKEVLRKLPIKFIEADIVKADVIKGNVHLRDGRHIPYDNLIIAMGSETNFFNIEGLKDNSLELKTFSNAIKLRNTIWEMIEGAKREDKIDIVIGGAGSAGIELAGEIQEWLKQLKDEGYNSKTGVTIIDAAPTILNRLDKSVIKMAVNRLNALKTVIICNEIIERVEEGKIHLKSGKTVRFDVLVWTGGVMANKLARNIAVKLEKHGQIETTNDMLALAESPDAKIKGQVYAIGDIAYVTNRKTGNKVPGIARAAISQAGIAAENIFRDAEGKKRIEYNPPNYPYVVPVGGKYTIAKVGPVIIHGFFGWIFKGLIELNYISSIMPVDEALKIWFKGLKIFVQNDRLG